MYLFTAGTFLKQAAAHPRDLALPISRVAGNGSDLMEFKSSACRVLITF